MISMVGAIRNAADVSGARGFMRDFAVDAGRMHRRLARISVPAGTDANEVNAPVAPTDPAAELVPLAPIVATDNVVVPAVPIPEIVAAPVPAILVIPTVTPALLLLPLLLLLLLFL